MDTPEPATEPSDTESAGEVRLILFVAGATPRATRAVHDVRRVCEDCLPGSYTLTVLDVRQHPDRFRSCGGVAVPMLYRSRPLPVMRLVGDLADHGKLQRFLQPDTAGTAQDEHR